MWQPCAGACACFTRAAPVACSACASGMPRKVQVEPHPAASPQSASNRWQMAPWSARARGRAVPPPDPMNARSIHQQSHPGEATRAPEKASLAAVEPPGSQPHPPRQAPHHSPPLQLDSPLLVSGDVEARSASRCAHIMRLTVRAADRHPGRPTTHSNLACA